MREIKVSHIYLTQLNLFIYLFTTDTDPRSAKICVTDLRRLASLPLAFHKVTVNYSTNRRNKLLGANRIGLLLANIFHII